MMNPQTLKDDQTITLEETGQTPTEPAKTTTRIARGFRKPSHKTAAVIFWITFAVVAVVAGTGIVIQDMRFVMAAIYFAVGFVFQRAGFCSASLLSAVVLSRDMRGLRAILVAVLTAMLGFGLMDILGWVAIYPGRMSVIPAAVAGMIFGIGMVFAGGCISGSLFKATEGHLPSIIAVAGIFAGLAAGLSPWGRGGIEFLTGLSESWKLPPNIVDPFGDAFAFMAVGIALIGLSAMCFFYRRRILDSPLKNAYPADGSWPLFGVAVIVGLLGWAAIVVGPYLGRTHPLGASHMPYSLLKYVFEGNARIVGLIAWTFVLGSALSAWLRGKLLWRTAPKGMLVLAYFGGVLVGFGAILGGGCFVGQILSGWALLSIHALIFGITMILANWATTLLYLRGWR
jgi:uncharacterized membrane protein YedE/YeeE